MARKEGILVLVDNGRYDMLGAPTRRNRWLAELLNAQGGVSDTVEPGLYVYNARFKFFKLVISLTPVSR